MKKVLEHYRDFVSHIPSIISFLFSIGLFIISLFINYFANQYSFIRQGSAVPDIILDNIPVVNMDDAFVVGTWLFLLFISALVLSRPKKISFVLKAIALFIITRAFFMILTHIGPSPFNTLNHAGEISRAFSSGADLFFSGHTGMPFLFALIYWHNKWLRYVFIMISILAAAGVLLGHIHYSIDVASAYFITYGMFIMTQKIFHRDYENFRISN
jgi:hypothetical protein